ncbi:MAG: hypothetical protein C0599_09380, partial [Salinivirgaceae bacterium]
MSNIDWMSITHPDDVQEDLDNMALLNAGKIDGFNMQKRYIKPDGSYVWINMTIAPMVVQKNQEPRHLCMIEDITEQKEMVQSLKMSEEKLRNIFENSTNIFYSHNTDHVLTYVSPQVEDILGYTQDEVKGNWANFTSDNPINELGFQYTLKAIETGKRQPLYNLELVKKSGEKVWVEVRETPIVENGKVVSIVGSVVDITERIEAIQVKESEARFKNMFLGHNATMLLIEPESGDIIDANDAAAKFYGYTKSNLCSININDLNTLSPEQVAIERNKALLKKRNHFIFNHRIANGTVRTVEVHSSPIKYEDKQILFSIIYDITEQKQAEQALIDSEKKLNIWINHSPACTKIVDPDLNLQFMSESGMQELKIEDVTEFYGKPYPFYFYPDSFKVPMRNNLEKVKKTGETITQEAAVLDIQGNELWYRSTLVPVFDDNEELEYIMIVSLEITDRKRDEQALKNNESRLKSLVSIFQRDFHEHRELLDFSLEESIKLTESKLGFICLYDNKTEQFSLFSWSKEAMKECNIEDPQSIFKLEKTGIWGDAVREKRAIIINDYHAPNSHKKGIPKGHAKLKKVIVIPVHFNNQIVAVVGVANKETDYTQNDVLHLDILMKNTWSILHKIENDVFIKEQNKVLTKLNKDKDK